MNDHSDAVAGGDQTGSAVDGVYSGLRRQIVDGELAPGERLNVDGIARGLRLSATPVREAMQRLEVDGLVDYFSGRGYRTTAVIGSQELRDLFEFRLLVEPVSAGLAARDGLVNPSRELDEQIELFARTVSDGHDVRQAMLAHDMRFHDIILAAAGNRVVRRAFAQTHCHLHVFRIQHVDVTGEETLREHRGILARIDAHDSEGAEQAMAEHIKLSFSRSSAGFEEMAPELRQGR